MAECVEDTRMQMQSDKRVTSMERAFRNAVREVLLVIDEFSDGHALPRGIDELRTAIAALPLPADERSSALQRIRNTHRYLAAGEKGAAIYELRALLQCLSGWAEENDQSLAFAPTLSV